MSQYSGPSPHKFSETDFPTIIRALINAVHKDDHDSGWVALPSAKVLNLNGFRVAPRTVHVYSSASPDGSNYQTELASSVSHASVAFPAVTNPYVRIIANK